MQIMFGVRPKKNAGLETEAPTHPFLPKDTSDVRCIQIHYDYYTDHEA
jgi:hypothetical protein